MCYKLKMFIIKVIYMINITPPQPHKFVKLSLVCGFSGKSSDPDGKGKGKAIQEQDEDLQEQDEDLREKDRDIKLKQQSTQEQTTKQQDIQQQNVQQGDTLLAQQRINQLHNNNRFHESTIETLKEEQEKYKSEIQYHLNNIPVIDKARHEAIKDLDTAISNNETYKGSKPPPEIARANNAIASTDKQYKYVDFMEKNRSELISIKERGVQEEEEIIEKNKKEMADLYNKFELSPPSNTNASSSSSSNNPSSSNVPSSSNDPSSSSSYSNIPYGPSNFPPSSDGPNKKPKLDLNPTNGYDIFGGFNTGYDLLHDIFDNYHFIFTICYLLSKYRHLLLFYVKFLLSGSLLKIIFLSLLIFLLFLYLY